MDVLAAAALLDEVADDVARNLTIPPRSGAQHETSWTVQAAVDDLPEPYRIPLSLHYFVQLSYAEIAARLHPPLTTVKSGYTARSAGSETT